MFEHTILPAVVLIGLCAIVLYGMYTERQDIGLRARKMALAEAAAALQSLADVATYAADQALKEPVSADRNFRVVERRARAYSYDRAASIVRSIPVDRL
jgi:hypothetical protein